MRGHSILTPAESGGWGVAAGGGPRTGQKVRIRREDKAGQEDSRRDE